jgi:FkbM family methyltransferase
MRRRREIARWALVRPIQALIGRRNLVRVARFVSNEARFDGGNSMDNNGELMVQEVAANTAAESGPLIALDVGANVGEWTHGMVEAAIRHGRTVIVHAFEPCPGTARIFEANIGQWKLADAVKLNEMALSGVAGSRVLYSHGSGQGRNSLHASTTEPAPFLETIRAGTLDEYSRSAELPFIDIMKIDTEGHDMEVLLGGENLFRRKGVGIVQFEYNHRWIAARHFLADAFEFFFPLDYCLGKVTPRGIEFYRNWHPELETFREANFVATTPEIAKQFPQIRWWNEP